jgi:hypothetical protein
VVAHASCRIPVTCHETFTLGLSVWIVKLRLATSLATRACASWLHQELPATLEAIIGRALEKDRELRYQSAVELRADLEHLKAGGVRNLTAEKADAGLAPASRFGSLTRGAALAVLAILAGGLVALGFHYRSERAKRLTEKDTIVLTDIANSTGDPVFDGTLKQALSVALSQSPFLNILPDSKVRATLRLMRQPENVAISNDLAGELCQRSGSKAYVSGAIAALGSEYVIGLKAENCQIGATLAEEQVMVRSKAEVISALGKAASQLRQKLGESISTIRKFDVPLREATTDSLEALKECTIGGQLQNEIGAAAAIPYFKRPSRSIPCLRGHTALWPISILTPGRTLWPRPTPPKPLSSAIAVLRRRSI